MYTSNSAPNIALARSTYQEQKWDTLRLNKDELYAENNTDPLEYHHGPSDVLKYSQIIAPREGDYYVRSMSTAHSLIRAWTPCCAIWAARRSSALALLWTCAWEYDDRCGVAELSGAVAAGLHLCD